jgi:hypothetical protein
MNKIEKKNNNNKIPCYNSGGKPAQEMFSPR